MRRTRFLIAIGTLLVQPLCLSPGSRAAAERARVPQRHRSAVAAPRVAQPIGFAALSQKGLDAQRRASYRQAADWLEQALRAPDRGRAGEAGYRIFTDLGAVYLALGDLNKANAYLQQGLANQARLGNAAKGQLYANLGYLYALQGDSKKARLYFSSGASLGSAMAQENLRRLNGSGR